MATITTLRPSATSSGVGWTASPSGTLHGVTSDDNDATAAQWGGSGSALILPTPVDAPPAGERRHLVRVRARGEDGSAWWAVRLASGSLVAGAAATFAASPETVIGSWQAGAPPDGSTVLSAYVTGQTTGVRIVELYVDVDSREAPTFTPQVLDGSGASTVTVADTNTPTIRASALDLDGLAARQYRYWVTQGATIVWDTGVTSGAPVNRMTAPLLNGSYTANLQIWTTLGTNTAYASEIETVDFTVNVGAVPAPDAPVVTPELPFERIEVCGADSATFDDYVSWVEVERVDCPSEVLYGWDSPSATALSTPGTNGNYASTPDTAALDIVGDIDVRIRTAAVSWTPAAEEMPIAKNNSVGDQRSWAFSIMTSGVLQLSWSTNGIGVSLAQSTVPTGFQDGTGHWIRVTLAVASGTVTFYVGEDGSNWTQLGAAVVVGATSIFSGTAPLTVAGRNPGGISNMYAGLTSRAEVRNGINGTVVANPQFDQQPAGTTSFADGTGKTWTIHGTAAIVPDQTDPDGWVGEGTTHVERVTDPVHDGSGALEATETFGAGFDEVRFNDASGLRDLSLGGPTLGAWVLVPVDASGTAWQGRLEVQDPSFTWVPGPNFTLTPGVWQFITYTPSPALLASMRSIGFAIGATDVSQIQAVVVDTLTQGWGDLTEPQTTTTVAILGPLEEDECAEVVDYSIPRTGVGIDPCADQVVECCSYYRARTVALVDGSLLVSEWTDPPAELTCFTWDEDYHLIRTTGPNGPMYAQVGGKFEWDVARPFTAATGVMGTRFVTSAPPGGRNLHMTAAVESEAALAELRAVLARPLVLISPSDAEEVWAAPVAESVRVVKIGRVRAVTADFVATGPEPGPQHADVGG